MMEHYSQLSFDRVKPFVISEYGGRARQIEKQPWSPFRDWMTMKSFNSMLLTFADRPQHILSALPFVIVKAEWGRLPDGTPYPWRLMRQAKEKNGETGDHWVFTEIVKFYQLWSDVRGKRVDIVSSDPDIQTNAFVNENKLYVVLNNLYFDETSLDLKVLERYGNAIQNVKVKHLHLNDAGDAPVLEEENFSTLESVNIGGEGTIVIEYTFEEDLVIDETVEEIKYYANQYLTEIIPFAEHTYQINGVSKGETGEALLRLGMGRPHGTSLQPTVKVNGQVVEVPENYMGYDQLTRSTWFGVIQIPVPFYYLQEDNEITVQFPDAEGHISSMSLRLFNQSDKIERTVSKSIESISLQPAFKQLEPQQEYALQTNIAPINAIDFSIEWTSNDENIATVDDFGKVTAINLGEATITASMGDIIASSTIEVVEEALPVAVTGLQISPESISLKPGDLLQMQSQISPIDATNQEVEWIISDTNIAEIDENGLLKTKRDGEIQVIGTSQDGSFSDTSTVTVVAAFGTFLRCNFLPSTLVSDTEYTVGIDYSAGYAYDLAIELKDADDNWIGEGRVTVEPGIGTATVVIKNVSTEDWTTPIYPEPGEGYILRAWIREVGGNWMTNMGGCSKGGITITANTTNTTDIELSEMMLYPNPTDDLLFLDLPKLKREAQLTIFDIYGKVVLQQDIIQKNSQLQLSNFAAGIYLVQVQTEKGSVTKRVVVE
ncbi:MAG: Ig-like domain-containing protein, partial [Bacteroidota bacterium]